jgi:allantoinase
MPQADLIIRGNRVVLPDSTIAASIHIGNGQIIRIRDFDDIPDDAELVEADQGCVVMAGLVDTHVHINEPGRTDWEGFETATRAAAAGGVTTIIDMPLNSIPPTTTKNAFEEKLASAKGKCHVDVGFWGGVVPGNTGELAAMYESGVVGFKCFLIHSGVEEFPNVNEADLRDAMPELKRLNALLIVHAEVPGPIEQNAAPDRHGEPTKYQTFLASRPRATEDEAIELMIRLSREFDTRVHIVHHSSANALPALRRARVAGVKITAETCPHYLFFAAEQISDGATEFKCCPPIRERENREQLWQALREDTIQMIVSDHSPCPPDLKHRDTGDFLAAWGGISSLQLRLPIIWTEARKRGHTLEDLTRWLCKAPADLVSLSNKKGRIEAGFDADIVIWNPEEKFSVDAQSLRHRHKVTPYVGEVLAGTVQKTFLRGKKIYDDGRLEAQAAGEFIFRER